MAGSAAAEMCQGPAGEEPGGDEGPVLWYVRAGQARSERLSHPQAAAGAKPNVEELFL